ncbi:MAG: L,D-transpeptidase family protein, partial [Nitrosotalea sp.]
LQKEEEHSSNLYDDASMPFMERITWSGIALHAGQLPGYPASHGCVRMPYEFAKRLFDVTKIGMRVIVARNDVRPAAIEHPALFRPKLVRADVALKALAHWDLSGSEDTATSPSATFAEADVPSPANLAEPLVTLKSIVAAKSAEADMAAKKADAARLTAARMTSDATRLLRVAEAAKYRADAQVRAADNALEAANSAAAMQSAEEEKSAALARLSEAEAQLAADKEEAPMKADAAARAREEARVAQTEKIAAMEASREAARVISPLSIFISRKTQRLYIRQSFQPVFESPVKIRDADDPIGTHIYTALDFANGGADLRWSAVSMDGNADMDQLGQIRKSRRHDGHNAEPGPPESGQASAALDRIEIAQNIVDHISEIISPGSSLIISDEGMSPETGEDTDFVILMSDEPQGGIKIRRHDPEARYHYDRQHDHQYGRAPAYPSSSGDGYSFVPW